jgi:hypothetical protein
LRENDPRAPVHFTWREHYWLRKAARALTYAVRGSICRVAKVGVESSNSFARPNIFPGPCRLMFGACAAAFCAVDDIRLR